MASQLKVDTITGVTTAGSIAVTGEGNSTTTNLQQGLCKAWCFWDQSDQSADDSFNVGSITDSAIGQSALNLSNAMSNANYTGVGGQSGSTTIFNVVAGPNTTSATFVRMINSSGTDTDTDNCQQVLQGDLA
jgi:hypothetical protein